MSEAARRVYLEHLVRVSAQIEAQLHSPAQEPIKAILKRARDDTADAIRDLLIINPNNAEGIRALQNKARRYDDLIEWLRSIVLDGKEADEEVTEALAEERRELILDIDEDTRIAMGLREPGAGTE